LCSGYWGDAIDKYLLSETAVVVLLAAEHRDDVSPISLYYDVNVQGAKNVLNAMDKNSIKSIVFTSSVAVYGLNKSNPDETHPADPYCISRYRGANGFGFIAA